MSDFTTIRPQFNINTDAAPTYTGGGTLAFGGSAGANEIRWCASGAGSSVGSAVWPQFSRPGAVAAVPEMWAFTTDTSGTKTLYNGANTVANVGRIDYDNVGTYASAPTLTAYGDTTHTAPVAGTQPGAFAGSPIVNGQASDTSSTSYLKANMFGTAEAVTTYPAAGSAGSAPAATTGTAGSVSPGAGAWLATWQSLQGAIQFITFPATPAATTQGDINFTLVLFTGPNMSLGTITPVITYTYSYV